MWISTPFFVRDNERDVDHWGGYQRIPLRLVCTTGAGAKIRQIFCKHGSWLTRNQKLVTNPTEEVASRLCDVSPRDQCRNLIRNILFRDCRHNGKCHAFRAPAGDIEVKPSNYRLPGHVFLRHFGNGVADHCAIFLYKYKLVRQTENTQILSSG